MQRNRKLTMQLNIQGNAMGRQHRELQAAEEARRVAEVARRTAEEGLDFSRRRQQELLAELVQLKAARQSEIAVMVQRSSRLAANSAPSVSRFVMSNLQNSRCSKPSQAITPPIPGPSSLVQGQPTPQALPSSPRMPTTAGFTFSLPEQAHPQVHAPTAATPGLEVGQGPPLEVPPQPNNPASDNVEVPVV